MQSRLCEKDRRMSDATATKDAPYPNGTHVVKHTGDYQIGGIVVASFKNLNGRVRYVVEHRLAPPNGGAIYHIYAPDNIKPAGD